MACSGVTAPACTCSASRSSSLAPPALETWVASDARSAPSASRKPSVRGPAAPPAPSVALGSTGPAPPPRLMGSVMGKSPGRVQRGARRRQGPSWVRARSADVADRGLGGLVLGLEHVREGREALVLVLHPL